MLLANSVREADGMVYVSSRHDRQFFWDVGLTRHYRISGRACDTFALTRYTTTCRGSGLKWIPAFFVWNFLTSAGQWAIGDVSDVFETWCREG